jgi:hypothetical protein
MLNYEKRLTPVLIAQFKGHKTFLYFIRLKLPESERYSEPIPIIEHEHFRIQKVYGR